MTDETFESMKLHGVMPLDDRGLPIRAEDMALARAILEFPMVEERRKKNKKDE
jgi:hypothetical protein